MDEQAAQDCGHPKCDSGETWKSPTGYEIPTKTCHHCALAARDEDIAKWEWLVGEKDKALEKAATARHSMLSSYSTRCSWKRYFDECVDSLCEESRTALARTVEDYPGGKKDGV